MVPKREEEGYLWNGWTHCAINSNYYGSVLRWTNRKRRLFKLHSPLYLTLHNVARYGWWPAVLWCQRQPLLVEKHFERFPGTWVFLRRVRHLHFYPRLEISTRDFYEWTNSAEVVQLYYEKLGQNGPCPPFLYAHESSCDVCRCPTPVAPTLQKVWNRRHKPLKKMYSCEK